MPAPTVPGPGEISQATVGMAAGAAPSPVDFPGTPAPTVLTAALAVEAAVQTATREYAEVEREIVLAKRDHRRAEESKNISRLGLERKRR